MKLFVFLSLLCISRILYCQTTSDLYIEKFGIDSYNKFKSLPSDSIRNLINSLPLDVYMGYKYNDGSGSDKAVIFIAGYRILEARDKLQRQEKYNRGWVQQIIGEYKSAISYYTESLELPIVQRGDANDILIRGARGDCKMMLEDYYGAIMDYNFAIETKDTRLFADNKSTYYLERGRAYTLLKNDQQGMIDVNKAIEINKNYAEAYYLRGLLHINVNEIESGCLDLSKAGELGFERAYQYIKEYCH